MQFVSLNCYLFGGFVLFYLGLCLFLCLGFLICFLLAFFALNHHVFSKFVNQYSQTTKAKP